MSMVTGGRTCSSQRGRGGRLTVCLNEAGVGSGSSRGRSKPQAIRRRRLGWADGRGGATYWSATSNYELASPAESVIQRWPSRSRDDTILAPPAKASLGPDGAG